MTLDKQDPNGLSRIPWPGLRHAPEKYFLEIDADGWVILEVRLLAIRYGRPEWSSIGIDDREWLFDAGEASRIECRDGCVRHSQRANYASSDAATRSAAIPPRKRRPLLRRSRC